MRTIVYQSYRTKNVSAWIKNAMENAKEWAENKGFDYAFIDDKMFDYVPEWYKIAVDNQVYPISDLARLVIAKEFLLKGYDRAIWLDADLIIMDPEHFDIPEDREFSLTKEIWMDLNKLGFATFYTRVCNTVLVVTKNNSLLDFYIYACKAIANDQSPWVNRFSEDSSIEILLKRLKSKLVQKNSKMSLSLVGTDFLTNLYKLFDFPLLKNVANLSPVLLNEIYTGKTKYLRSYIRRCNNPMFAVNLINSFQNLKVNSILMEEQFYEKVYQNLIETKGNLINDLLTN